MPNKILPLSQKEMLLVYKDIILYYENKVAPNPKGFRKNDSHFASFLKNINASFTVVDGASTITIPNSFKHNDDAFIIIKPVTHSHNRLSALASLLSHLRNCFAHGHFTKIKIGKKTVICMEDYYCSGNTAVRRKFTIT